MIIAKFKNNCTFNNFNAKNSINKYYELGLINILKHFEKNNKYFITNNGIDLASMNGHVCILDWFRNSNLEFKYTEHAVDWASKYGHICILDWFKNSDLEFKYTNHAVDSASRNNHVCVLDWFQNNNSILKSRHV